MILVDTSVWVDHLRHGDPVLSRLLEALQVTTHPFVIGELALGSLRQRNVILEALRDLPRAPAASDEETQIVIERHELFGLGIGYVDAHLVAATLLNPGMRLWTRDKRLRGIVVRMNVGAELDR